VRFVSFVVANQPPRFGVLLTDELVLDCYEAAEVPQPAEYLEWFDEAGASHGAARQLAEQASKDPAKRRELEACGAAIPLADVQLLAPVPRPGKVLCIGLNYRDHAEESKMAIPEAPLIFSKFPTSVCGPEHPVLLAAGSTEVDYEAEFGVVIGRTATRVAVEDAMDAVLGYTNVNDVSARDFQFADGQWQRGKSCDTFAPSGPWLVSRDAIADPHKLRISFRLNGKTLQDSNTDQLIFGVPQLVSYISESITLEPGDLIATGTPPGVGFARKPPIYLQDGDRMEVEVEGLGVLHNPCTRSSG